MVMWRAAHASPSLWHQQLDPAGTQLRVHENVRNEELLVGPL